MAAVGMEEDQAVQAARILLNLRNRRLQRWPAWVLKDSAGLEDEVRLPPKTKRQRTGKRLRGGWPVVMAPPNLGLFAASGPSHAGSDASSSGEDPERSPAPRHWRVKSRVASVRDDELTAPRPDSPVYYRAPAGSGSSLSADRKARTRHVVEMAGKAPPASASPKEPMKASSPETPLDFGAKATGSGASSSGDDGARRPSKRKAPGPLGSGGGASSGDEGCSSSDKRARGDAGHAEKAISEATTQTPESVKVVKFEFDLNMPCPDEDECPGFC